MVSKFMNNLEACDFQNPPPKKSKKGSFFSNFHFSTKEAMNQTVVLIFSSLLQKTQEKLISPLQQHLFITQNPKLFHLFITLLIIILTAIIHSLYKNKNRHGLPYSYPLLGMLPSLFYALSTNVHEWHTKVLNQNNGTFIFKGLFFDGTVVTSNSENMEYFLKTHFSNFVKGEFLRTHLEDLLGDGIFNADGDSWLRQRKVSSVEFHSAEFRNLTTESLLELVHSRLIPVLEEKEGENGSGSFDLQEILLRLTFDNVCMIAFGVDPGCLNLGLSDVPFARAFESATEVIYLRMCVPIFVWKVMKFFNLGWERRMKGFIQEVDEFAEEVIAKRMKELTLGSDKDSRSDILSIFMGLKDDEGKPFSNKFLRDICVNFILAGRDTSSVALTWFFWLLDQNPVVEERILEELCRIVAERGEEFGDVDRNNVVFSADEVKKMDYLLAAISESLRLYPSVPSNRKEVIEDDVFPDGTVLKKGTKIVYSIYTMGRMESLWGKDCWEFKPERWLKDGQFMSESPYKFTAFNGGPRLCLGKEFANYQMKFVAASIIYRYRVKVVENHLVEPKLAITMYMKYGLKVTLKRRDHVHGL